jgi:hypothetical protein
MKADLPLSERKRIQEDEGREIRAALVARHFGVLNDERAIQVAQLDQSLRAGVAFSAARAQAEQPVARESDALPQVAPEPVDAGPDLRGLLGLK